MNKISQQCHYYVVCAMSLLALSSGCVAQHVGGQNNAYFFSFDSASVKPFVVSKGGELTVEWTYTIRNVPRNIVKPMEKLSIYKGDTFLAVLQEKSFRVEDGTWQDYLVFELPRRLSVGKYTIQITLTDGNAVYNKQILFNIR